MEKNKNKVNVIISILRELILVTEIKYPYTDLNWPKVIW